jgi:hypothetical protein
MAGKQLGWVEERKAVPLELEANRERRAKADAERDAARDELRDLLARGQAVALDVAAMAATSGVSRDTAHRLLRSAGSLSLRQKHRLAEAAGIPQGPERGEWFKAQGLDKETR